MNRRGFTLIELAFSLSIMLIIAALTITMLNVSADAERISSSARQVQSYILGARDRAIHVREIRGVRFVLDPSDPRTINGMVYIGSPRKVTTGFVVVGGQGLLPAEDSGRYIVPDAAASARWESLYRQGMLVDDSPIWIGRNQHFNTLRRITDGSGNFLRWQLGRRPAGFWDSRHGYSGQPVQYALQIQPAILPNQEPRLLPRGIVIDLDNSQIPAAWSSGGSYINSMDILFSPRGSITGRLTAAGTIRFVLADVVDVERDLPPGDPSKEGDELVLSISTQTGSVTTHSVDPTDSDSTPGADDPFRYARLGEVSQ